MPVPKSVMKINKDGVTYESSVDKAQYTIHELTRAALRDVGKFICKAFRTDYYSKHSKKTGKVGKYTQYWVKSKQDNPELQVGIKPNAFYGIFTELGTSKQPKEAILTNAVQNNIAKIREIESQYLEYLEDEAKALAKIDEDDYEGGASDE